MHPRHHDRKEMVQPIDRSGKRYRRPWVAWSVLLTVAAGFLIWSHARMATLNGSVQLLERAMQETKRFNSLAHRTRRAARAPRLPNAPDPPDPPDFPAMQPAAPSLQLDATEQHAASADAPSSYAGKHSTAAAAIASPTSHSDAAQPSGSLRFPYVEPTHRIYTRNAHDASTRCRVSGICDHDTSCGADGLGCVQDATKRLDAIKEAARWSWKGYKRTAWGHDEMGVRSPHNPSSPAAIDWLYLGLTISDSLDTLALMGLHEEYKEARDWVVKHLDPDRVPKETSVFETSIRIVGGLLSAFYLSGGADVALLEKARLVADRLLPAFDTYTGVPHVFWRLGKPGRSSYWGSSSAPPPPWADPYYEAGQAGRQGHVGRTNIAAAGTYLLEFTTLSRITGDPKYARAAMRFWKRVTSLGDCDGLYCVWFDAESMSCVGSDQEISFGASADSFYEYMLKQWIMTGKQDTHMRDLYVRSIRGLRKHLVAEVTPYAGYTTLGAPANTSASQAPAAGLSPLAGEPFWMVGIGRKVSSASCDESELDSDLYGGWGRQLRKEVRQQQQQHQHQAASHPGSHSQRDQGHGQRQGALGRETGDSRLAGDRSTQGKGLHAQPPPLQQADRQQAPQRPTGAATAAHTPSRALMSAQSQREGQIGDAQRQAPSGSIRLEMPGGDPGTTRHAHGVQSGAATTQAATPAAGTSLELQQAAESAQPRATAGWGAEGDSSGTAQADAAMTNTYGMGGGAANPYEVHADGMRYDSADGLGTGYAGAGRHQRREFNRHSGYAQVRQAMGPVQLRTELQHFMCFVPGMLVLGHMYGLNTSLDPETAARTTAWRQQLLALLSNNMPLLPSVGRPPDRPTRALAVDDLELAARLARGCYELYAVSPTGVAGDIIKWSPTPAPPPPVPYYQQNRRWQAGDGAPASNSDWQGQAWEQEQQGDDPLHQPDDNGEGRRRLLTSGAASDDGYAKQSLEQDPPGVLRAAHGAEARVAPDSTNGSTVEAAAIDGSQSVDGGELNSRGHGRQLQGKFRDLRVSPPPPPSPAPPPPDLRAPELQHASWLDAHDHLRPEVIESLYYLYQATREQVYRDWGWQIFRAFQRYCRLKDGGYATLDNAVEVPPTLGDRQESFWVAETLKYLYLLFSDDASDQLNLGEWVLNTEAHPLPVWGSKAETAALTALRSRKPTE